MKNRIPDGERERAMAEELWLNYFNRYLLEQGVITENEYARMADLILKETRKARAKKEA